MCGSVPNRKRAQYVIPPGKFDIEYVRIRDREVVFTCPHHVDDRLGPEVLRRRHDLQINTLPYSSL